MMSAYQVRLCASDKDKHPMQPIDHFSLQSYPIDGCDAIYDRQFFTGDPEEPKEVDHPAKGGWLNQ